MTILYNRSEQKQLRRRLRSNMPAPELILWSKLRNGQLFGLRFRRQYSVGAYVLDFYCPRSRVAVEIDGESHFTSEGCRHDARRSVFLQSANIRVLRVTNADIMTNLAGVLEAIAGAAHIPRDRTADAALHPRPPSSVPRGRTG
jgi:very-short-patch-repair endonuclease